MLTTIWRFEEPDGVAPSDELGGVADLVVPSGQQPAALVDGVLGRARYFESAVYQGTDLVSGATLHTRDVSVQVVLAWSLDDQSGSGPGTIVCRGLDASTAERYAFGLELRAVTADVGELRWFWQTAAGTLKTQIGGHFRVPTEPGGFVLLTATRRWVSSSEVELRYYAGADLLAEVLSSDGDIGGGTTGHITVGGRRTAPSTWGNYLWGSIDELAIFDHALCAEEVESTWRRITEHQPAGVELMQDLAPPGAPISNDPASRIQRLLRVIGEGLGFAAAKGEHVREYTLPDRAFGATLERWESITRQSSRPRTALEVRRRRVISHLRSRGIDINTVREALREVLDLHPSQIEILNFSNDITDDFATLRTERWSVRPGPVATWSVAGGKLQAQALTGDDIRWLGGVTRRAARCRLAVPVPRGMYLGARMEVAATWPLDVDVGLLLEHGSRGDRLFFGVRNHLGTREVVYQRWRANVLVDTSPVVLTSTSGATHWLRIRPDPSPFFGGPDETHWILQWSTDGAAFDEEADVTWINDHQWAGFYARSEEPSLAADLTVKFDQLLMRLPFAPRPFRWYAYRDPSIAGVPDLVGANALLRRLRHAYTVAAAVTSRSLLCDTGESGCDLGPMGGI